MAQEEPIPTGWKLWLDPKVPPELVDFAKKIRDKVRSYPYGKIAETTTDDKGRTIGAFVSHHEWSYLLQPDGTRKLTHGLNIPGVSLVIKQPDAAAMAGEAAFGIEFAGDTPVPHPDAARFLATGSVTFPAMPLVVGAVVGAVAIAVGAPLWLAAGAAAGAAWLKAKS